MRHAGSLALRLCGCALLMVATAAPAALAQSVSGTILGTVTDSSGAVVAGAKVTIINEGTGAHAHRHLRRQRRVHRAVSSRPATTRSWRR